MLVIYQFDQFMNFDSIFIRTVKEEYDSAPSCTDSDDAVSISTAQTLQKREEKKVNKEKRKQQLSDIGWPQVWSLTQVYAVASSLSWISVKNVLFTYRQGFCQRFLRCPVTTTPSRTHMAVS